MDWRTYYKEHTMKPEDAVSVIKDGDRVVFGHAVGEPIIFQRTMAQMAQQFHNVEVAHMVYLGSGEYLQPGMEEHFRQIADERIRASQAEIQSLQASKAELNQKYASLQMELAKLRASTGALS